MGFFFRGKHSDEYLLVNGIERDLMPAISAKLLQVSGHKGAYNFGSDMEVRRYKIKATVTANTEQDLERKLDDIRVWLYGNGKEGELIFDDKPQVSYMAQLDGDTPREPLGTSVFFTFTLLCAESNGEGIEKVYEVTNGGGIVDLVNDGTDEAFPNVSIKFTEDAHTVAITNGTEHVLVGKPKDVTQPTTAARTCIVFEDFIDTTRWTQGIDVDGGAITGDFVSNGKSFHQKDWDYGKYWAWHGAAKVLSLPEEVQDFTVDLSCTFRSYKPEQLGRVELYLLDKNRAVLGKAAIMDMWDNSRQQVIEARAGTWLGSNQYFVKSYGGYSGYWNDWANGMISITRKGDTWAAYFCIYDPNNGHHKNWHYQEWVDTKDRFMGKVAAIQVHVGAYGEYEAYEMYLNDMQVYRYNTQRAETDNDIPFIAGDRLEINNEKAAIYLNGKPANHLLDPSSDYFSIPVGRSQLGIYPSVGETTVRFKNRYL